jgi:hypothetical protein
MANVYHSRRNRDPNWFTPTQYYRAVNNTAFDMPIGQQPVRMDGDTRIRDVPRMPISVRPMGYTQPEKPIVEDNIWPMKYFSSHRDTGDVYSHYKYTDVPNGIQIPRSRADGAEFRRAIQNEHLYRRESEYELQNTVIHPTHFSEMTPERLAADPNQAIHNYYKGMMDPDDKQMQKTFQRSRWRDTVRKNRRRTESQIYTFIDGGESVKYEEIEPLYW